ncbi:MAG: ribulose-phosphate 3-epimerase [Waddliaceae bacterium]|nr:ribulose-phosphate 3-epimerase [Waddliaceae bacterium]
MKKILAPSILAGDHSSLKDSLLSADQDGRSWIHLDIMDGHFVRNITIGSKAVAAIRRATSLPLDVHLMIYNPYDYIESFVEAGADMITIQFEATEDVTDTLEYIRKCNVKAGLAFNPETSESLTMKFLDKCDMMLMMTVNPGFGGQEFIPEVLEKIRFVREMCDNLGVRAGGVTAQNEEQKKTLPPFDIQVDGGVTRETGRLAIDAGANVLVSGTYLLQQEDLKEAIASLRSCAQQ